MGSVVIHQDGQEPIKRDLSTVIVVGIDQDMPRELLAMNDTYRVLQSISAAEAARVARWLCEMFPEVVTVRRG